MQKYDKITHNISNLLSNKPDTSNTIQAEGHEV